MKYKIDIQDALVLKSMLLEMGGSYADIMLARQTANAIFSPEDLKAYRVTVTPEGLTWNMTGEDGNALPATRDVELGPEIVKLLKSAFNKLNEAKALKPFQVGLYEMFVMKPKAS